MKSIAAGGGNKRAKALDNACAELLVDPPASVYRRMLLAVMLGQLAARM